MNEESIRHSVYHQLDECVVHGRSARVQERVPCLLTKQYVCCLLRSTHGEGEVTILSQCACLKLTTVQLAKLAANCSRGTNSELVVHTEFNLSFFVIVNIDTNLKLKITTKKIYI